MEFKFIHQLNYNQLKELYKLVSNAKEMKLLGNGQPWNKKKFIEIYKFDCNDYKNKYKNSRFLYNVLIDNNKLIGIGFIHPGIGKYKNHNQAGMILNKKYRNKGYGKIFLNHIVKLHKKYMPNKKLYGFSRITNILSNGIAKYYKYIGIMLYNKVYYNVYLMC